MKSNKAKRYNDKIESWALSEIKDTFVVTYQTYLGTRSEYARAVHLKIGNPDIAKSNMVASLDAYFQNSQAPFVPFLIANETDLLKKAKLFEIDLTNITELLDYYRLLPEKGMIYTSQMLFYMGNLLTEWNMASGYFRMVEISKEYHSEDDHIADILDDESN